MKVVLSMGLALILGGCAHRPRAAAGEVAGEVVLPPHGAEPPPPAPLDLNEARALAMQHCASCHQASVSRAKLNALAVFDLDQPEWSAGLSAGQYEVFYARMADELDPTTRARMRDFTRAQAALVSAR